MFYIKSVVIWGGGGGCTVFCCCQVFFHYDAWKLALIIVAVCLPREFLQLPRKPNIRKVKITPDVFYYNLEISLYKTDVNLSFNVFDKEIFVYVLKSITI